MYRLRNDLACDRRESAETISTALLGGIERFIGARDEVVLIGVLSQAGGADAGGDLQLRIVRQSDGAIGNLVEQAFAERRHVVEITVECDHQEFLAPVPHDPVGGSARLEEQAGDVLENEVADRMTIRVVDVLEVIEVDEQGGQRPLRPPCKCHLGSDHLVEIPAIEGAGQRIPDHVAFQFRDADDVARRGRGKLGDDEDEGPAGEQDGRDDDIGNSDDGTGQTQDTKSCIAHHEENDERAEDTPHTMQSPLAYQREDV
ncbi:hypothetical protein MKK49_15560 [Methylobacterium sp. J-090]|nr:hypothetical protein [Methylobacterium sp. J-090]MCJ2082672.1 hypothetical protein [Methylobacterium sp. J-090]